MYRIKFLAFVSIGFQQPLGKPGAQANTGEEPPRESTRRRRAIKPLSAICECQRSQLDVVPAALALVLNLPGHSHDHHRVHRDLLGSGD
jgi:hypothetical protein